MTVRLSLVPHSLISYLSKPYDPRLFLHPTAMLPPDPTIVTQRRLERAGIITISDEPYGLRTFPNLFSLDHHDRRNIPLASSVGTVHLFVLHFVTPSATMGGV